MKPEHLAATGGAPVATSSAPSSLDIVIFGGAGDLSLRKLLPALYMAHLHGRLVDGARIIGVGRQEWSRADYLAFVNERSRGFIEETVLQDPVWAGFLERLDYVCMDANASADYARLKACCARPAQRVWCWRNRWVPIWPRRAPSMPRWRATSARRRPTASTTTWARRRCRT